MSRIAGYIIVCIASVAISSCRENSVTSSGQVDRVVPESAAPTMMVKILGKNFSTTPTGNQVKFNGVEGTVTNVKDTELTVEVPKGGSTGNITVSSFGTTAKGPEFQYVDMKIVFNDLNSIKVWSNGEVETWSNTSRSSYGYSAALKGDDLHVAGSFYDGVVKPCYWKNKVEIDLPTNGSAITSDIAIVGDDIYISGYDLTTSVKRALYWKNGNSIPLTGLSYGDETTSSIKVMGEDVYVGGSVINAAGKQVAVYWKNGVLHQVSDGTFSSSVKDILVNDADIHLVLEEYSPSGLYAPDGGISIIYMKNSTAFRLTEGSTKRLFSGAGRMTMANSRVYIPGWDNKDVKNRNVARLWIDGVQSPLIPGELYTRVNWVGIVGDDVIVAGIKTDATMATSSIFFMVNDTETIVSGPLPVGLVKIFVKQQSR
ncbi:MAG TPA: IPT/TIG domain-containing protein [Cyclobacteriaceae bacterium]|nr:IPT/TIG domain-containing protein [Cyclobacteriaceae bacterium]